MRDSQRLLAEGKVVIGVDSLNDYYDIRLKQHRLDDRRKPDLEGRLSFHHVDIKNLPALDHVFELDTPLQLSIWQHVLCTWADISKAATLPQRNSMVSLEMGGRKTVAWHQEDKSWVDDIKIDMTV